MKNRIKFYGRTLFVVALMMLQYSTMFSQVKIAFTQRTSAYSPTKLIYSIKGDYTMIGNTNLTVNPYGINTNNSNNTSQYVDIDSDPNTLNSSSATLALSTENGADPSCSTIIYAGLYWTGRCSNGSSSPENFTVTKGSVTKNYNKRTISLKGPGQANYTQFTANPGNIYFPNASDGFMYSAYIEVTDYVKANGAGEYIAADIALIEGNGGATGYYGGWGLIVVYENSKMNWRDVTIFDGHAYVAGNASLNYELPVSGFNTAQAGPINMKLGLMAGEGDVGITGDYFNIRNHQDNAWVSLNHSGNTTSNFFNSSVNTGGNPRYPVLQNNTGLDIAMFNIPNTANSVITNNQTSTKFQYGSTQDTYVIFCIAMSVDAYVPDVDLLVSTETINGLPVDSTLTILPGQDIEYKLQIKNNGTEAIDSALFTVPIPYTASFVAGSISTSLNFTPASTPDSAYFDSSIGLTGAVVWDIGTIPFIPGFPDSVLAELTFHLKVTENCFILKNPDCPPKVTLSDGVIGGKGAVSGISFSNKPFIQGYQSTGPCTGEPIKDPIVVEIDAAGYIATNCIGTPDEWEFVFCNYTDATIPVDSISNSFPTGLRFYNTNKVTPQSIEYNDGNPFPALEGTHTYFAIPDSSTLCYYTFNVVVRDVQTVPITSDIVYCLNATASALTAVPSDTSYSLFYYTSFTGDTSFTSIIPTTNTAGFQKYYVAEGIEGECISPLRDSIQVTVYDIQGVIDSTSQKNNLCKGDNLGEAKVVVSGGTGNYSYSWSTIPTQTAAIATGLMAGNYTVTVTDTDGCLVPITAIATVTEPALVLSAKIDTAGITHVLCKGQNSGVASVIPSGGSGNYSYSWSTIPTQIDSTAIHLTAGSYTVTVSDNNGCVVPAKAVATITEPLAPLGVTINSGTLVHILCNGQSTGSAEAIATGGSGGYTYSWSSSPVQTTAIATGLPAGTYTVTVSDTNGCALLATATATITEPTVLIASIDSIAHINVLCKGGNTGAAKVIVSGGSGSYSYSWNSSPVQTTAKATGLLAGSYTVTVMDNNGCPIPAKADTTITEPIFPLGAIIDTASITHILCKGQTTGAVTVIPSGGSGGYHYLWTTVPAQIDSTAIHLTAGSYTVTVSDNNGCVNGVSAVVDIEEPSVALEVSINAATLVHVLCNGQSTGSAEAIATGGSGGYTYSWSSSPIQTTAIATGLPAGTYTVTVSDTNGCALLATATATITEPTVLIASIDSIAHINVLCKGGNTGAAKVIVSGGSGSYSYSWNSSPVQTTAKATGLLAGSYTVTVMDNNGCPIPAKADTTITEPIFPLGAIIDTASITHILCKGQTTGAATVIASGGSGGYHYLWTTVPAQIGATAVNLVVGTYSVTVTDTNGCVNGVSAVVDIEEPSVALEVSINAGTLVHILCKGQSTGSAEAIATGGSGGYTYSWSTSPAQTTSIITGLAAGNYTVSVTDTNGCVVVATAIASITEPGEDLSASINTYLQTDVLCNGGNSGSTTVFASGGSDSYSYSWSTSPVQTTTVATGLSQGSYTVTVIDNNGCPNSATAVAIINEPVLLTTDAVPQNSICKTASGSVNLRITGGTQPYSYAWSTGSTDEDIYNLKGGMYYVEVTDKNACTVKDTVSITETHLNIDLYSPLYEGGFNLSGYQSQDGEIDLTIDGMMPPYTIEWSNGSVNEDLTRLKAGSYSVVVTDSQGCSVSEIITLTEPLKIEMPTAYSPNGDGDNDFFVIHGIEVTNDNKLTVFNRWGSVVYQVANYQNDWNGESANNELLPDATYFVIFEMIDKNVVLKGYVDIKRK